MAERDIPLEDINGNADLDETESMISTLDGRLRSENPDWYYEPAYIKWGDFITGRHIFKKTRAYYRRISGNFGTKFVLMLVCAYLLVKGFVSRFLESGILPYFKNYLRVSGQQYHDYGTIAAVPWGMKALFGAISDSIPIRGYNKRYYIMFAGLACASGFIALALGSFTIDTAGAAALMFFLGHLGVVIVDLLMEGKYAEMMVEKPHTGSDVVTWVWGMNMTGSILASTMLGPLADAGYIKDLFWLCVPTSAQIGVTALLGWLPEKKVKSSGCIDVKKIKTHKKIFLLALCMFCGALGIIFMTLWGTPNGKLIYALASSTVLCGLAFLLLPPMMARCNLYMFLVEITYVQINGAGEYYYTAKAPCLNDGPQFSYVFFQTWSTIVQAVFGALGVVLFQTVLSKWKFRPVFWVTILMKVFASVFDVIIVNRWNIALGISDHAMFMIGDNIFYKVAYMMDFMPLVILTSKLCPKNMESTVYALLAGFQNFGQSIARSIGSYMLHAFDIRAFPDGDKPCNWENFSTVIIIAHLILPLVAIPFTFCLIPDARLTDDLIGGAAKGSSSAPYSEFENEEEEEEEGSETEEAETDDDMLEGQSFEQLKRRAVTLNSVGEEQTHSF